MDVKKEVLKNISITDIKIAVAIGLCLLMALVIPEFQTMTACIATLLCVQTSVKESWKASLTRLVITTIGGIVAILVILVDNAVGNPWLFMSLIMLGIILTLFCCKLAKVPAFNARIGGVTFILVVLTRTESERIDYALFRLLSTIYGVLVVMIVAAIFAVFSKNEYS
jgi:uncharacterized membrane protein YgaE (UPF0421/DUF939 family)